MPNQDNCLGRKTAERLANVWSFILASVTVRSQFLSLILQKSLKILTSKNFK